MIQDNVLHIHMYITYVTLKIKLDNKTKVDKERWTFQVIKR